MTFKTPSQWLTFQEALSAGRDALTDPDTDVRDEAVCLLRELRRRDPDNEAPRLPPRALVATDPRLPPR